MVLLESKPSLADFYCPDFSLPSVDDKNYNLQDFASSQALLVAFICNHCPYVKAIENRLIHLKDNFGLEQLQIIGICSNDAKKYTDDSKSELFKIWRDKNYGFPYLVDESQEVARAFNAICTPDLFLFDLQRKIYYHGRLDDNWQDQSLVGRQELKEAIKDLLAGKPAPATQNPSMGCSIKWR